MTEQKFNVRTATIVLMVLVAGLWRLVPHIFGFAHFFNFSPLGAMALFGAAYFSKKQTALVLPFLALWGSNLLIDNIFYAQYYEGFTFFANWEVYVAFAAIVGLGFLFLKKVTPLRLLGAGLSASVLFFVVTNFVVWATTPMYAKNMVGLLECYTLAIPFFKGTLYSDLFFVTVLFGGYELAKAKLPALQRV